MKGSVMKGSAMKRLWLLLSLGLISGLPSSPVTAHPLDPALLELWENPHDEVIQVLWRIPASRPRQAPLEPMLPQHCRQLDEGTAHRGEQRLSLRFEVLCADPADDGLRGDTLGVRGLAIRKTDVLLRVHLTNGQLFQTVLRADAPTTTVPGEPRPGAVARAYLLLGCAHIASGFDHLAFVLGLLVLVAGRRQLILTITAFTLGHSITLALATLGWLRLPQAPVELAIAVSIWLLAVEMTRRPPGTKQRPTAPMAAAFGLLHGLGFASALTAAGLPRGDVPLALLAFNLGIELGQLAFVAAVLAGVLLARAVLTMTMHQRWMPWQSEAPSTARGRLALPTAYLIGSLACCWIFERGAGMVTP